jgi:hypothetical protein
MQQRPLLIALSAVGVSLVVHRSRTRSHRARGASDSRVTDGQVVTVHGTVDGDAVDATDLQRTNGTDVEGIVQSIDTTAPTLTISAEDSEESGSTAAVDVPASLDLSLSTQGELVEPIVSPNPDGTYTFEQPSNDTGAQNADNQDQDQGDNNRDNHNSAEQVSAAHQSDPNLATSHNGESVVQFWATGPNSPKAEPVDWRPTFRPAGGAERP